MITNRKSLLQRDGTLLIKHNLCDYSDAYILVTGNIQNKPANSVAAFKNCAPFVLVM